MDSKSQAIAVKIKQKPERAMPYWQDITNKFIHQKIEHASSRLPARDTLVVLTHSPTKPSKHRNTKNNQDVNNSLHGLFGIQSKMERAGLRCLCAWEGQGAAAARRLNFTKSSLADPTQKGDDMRIP